MVTARTQTWQLLVLRLVVHPAIWGIVTALFSHTLQHIGEQRRQAHVWHACAEVDRVLHTALLAT